MSAADTTGTQAERRQAEPATDKSARPVRGEAEVGLPRRPAARRRSRFADLAWSLGKTVATLAILALGVLAALVIWNYYVTAPWTRDGRMRVQVASVAPQVSGQITQVHVIDNQYVHKGDTLYVIDPFDFQAALDTARTTQRMRAADLQVKRAQSERRQSLSNLATTPEQQQQYAGDETQARAAFQAAQVAVSQAEVNLARTTVTSPVNGYVTNLLMRVGDYAHEGTSNISVIDADSYWVDGYFEETKMANVCVGDRAEAQLMGYAAPILGRVETITRGISVSDAAASTQGLPNVDPVYTWVRLAQRVPVRISITDVPPGVPLVSGMTATVSIVKGDATSASVGDRLAQAWARVGATFSPPPASPQCIPVVGDQKGVVTTLPTPQPAPLRSPGEINPGLAPGLTASPKQ